VQAAKIPFSNPCVPSEVQVPFDQPPIKKTLGLSTLPTEFARPTPHKSLAAQTKRNCPHTLLQALRTIQIPLSDPDPPLQIKWETERQLTDSTPNTWKEAHKPHLPPKYSNRNPFHSTGGRTKVFTTACLYHPCKFHQSNEVTPVPAPETIRRYWNWTQDSRIC
jgi:hypothetical protein